MYEIEYVTGTGGKHIGLDGDALYSGSALPLHSSQWTYELGYRHISSVSRSAREVELEITSVSDATMDEFRRYVNRDVSLRTPGRIVYRGGMYQRCYIVKTDAATAAGRFKTVKFTVVLLDGVWREGHEKSFMTSIANSGEFLNYPHPYPYDYSLPDSGTGVIENTQLLPAPVSLTFWGPAANPAVTIGGNRYACDITIDKGSRLEIDGIAKSITLIDQRGKRSNEFSTGRRGRGEGGGEYVFERVPSGAQSISWSGGFGFDLTLFEESMEVPWSIS